MSYDIQKTPEQLTNEFKQIEKLTQGIEIEFNSTKSENAQVKFEQECKYALQLLNNSRNAKYKDLFNIAVKNPVSLKDAIVNVAAVDLSLSPVTKLAYLVPRDGKICLDISYLGLIQLAIDSGSVKFVRSEVVREGDRFELQGMNKEPIFNYNPFDRERLKKRKLGTFCCAFLHDGSVLTDVMLYEEAMEIKKVSKGANSPYSPWVKYEDDMLKKTVLKKSQKLWPKQNSKRLSKAIEIIDEHEGFDHEAQEKEIEQKTEKVDYKNREKLIEDLKKELSEKTASLDNNKKGLFMLDFCGISSFKEVERKKESEIEIMISCVKTGVLFDKKKGGLK